MTTLFEQLGGKAAVDAAVDKFYEKVLADPTINYFFKNTDMNKQRVMQKAFMTMAFGGPSNYHGKALRKAHANLKLEEKHFTAVAKHLQSTLEDLKVPKNLIDQVMTIVGTTHDDVLNI